MVDFHFPHPCVPAAQWDEGESLERPSDHVWKEWERIKNIGVLPCHKALVRKQLSGVYVCVCVCAAHTNNIGCVFLHM